MFSSSTKKVSIFFLILVTTASCTVTFLITKKVLSKSYSDQISSNTIQPDECSFRVKRLEGVGLIKPILYVESSCESEGLQMLKNDINQTINAYTADGTLISASAYIRNITTSEWISINGAERFSPGSMLKVPEMITYLRMNEKHPGLLEQKVIFDKPYTSQREAIFVSESIKTGQSYTFRELINYMIKYSDNNATMLLNKHVDIKMMKQVFEDFGLEIPDQYSATYNMTAADYSRFMRALFNGSYLSREDSEYAIELLTKSDFNLGIAQAIPKNIKIAHKFGEEGNPEAQQLHESAIIYLENSPYLITVMTKGKDIKKQTKVLQEISAKAYQTFASR
jgi:beta-lactamase class A